MGEKLPPQAYEIMEARDEAQILAEIQGQILEEMVYSFRVGGREVTGISWVGIKEIARRYGKIDVDLIQLLDSPEVYTIIVKAKDIEKGNGMLGVSTQAKVMQLKNKETQIDQFALQKALSKAQRNAIRALIPETFFKTIFSELSGGKKPEPRKQVDAEASPVASPKPKWDPDEQTVITTLEVHGLPVKDLSISKYGIGTKNVVVRVEPQEGFPQEMFKEYDKVLKLVHAKWLALENRWEVPVSG